MGGVMTSFLRICLVSFVLSLAGCQQSSGPSPSPQAERQLTDGVVSAAVDTGYVTALQQIYVGYFGRPADPGGLAYFADILARAGAPTNIVDMSKAYADNAAVKAMIDSFGTSAESQALYSGDNDAFITAIYHNCFNRDPDPQGRIFWAHLISIGAITRPNAALAIMAGAQAGDLAIIANKTAVAIDFTNALDTPMRRQAYAGPAPGELVRNMLHGVTLATQPPAFQRYIDATLAQLVAPIPLALTVQGAPRKIAAGSLVSLSWNAPGASGCVASGSWSGAVDASGGQQVVVGDGGPASYAVDCLVNGTSSRLAANLIIPHSVRSTSYENKAAINIPGFAMPNLYDPSMANIRAALDSSEIMFATRSLSFGDFLQDGSYSMFVTAVRYTDAFPGQNLAKWADGPSKAYFLSRDADGMWRDNTAALIPRPEDRFSCVTVSYSIVADFNNDGRPDIYLACTGIDFQLNGQWTADQNSDQFIYVSQPNGTYKLLKLPIGKIYGHQASAGDIDGDGNIDIVTADPYVNGTPFVLWGNGDGTFRQDLTRMPVDMLGKHIFGVMLLPVGGKLELIASGTTPSVPPAQDPFPNTYGTKILHYVDGAFVLEHDLTPALPLTTSGDKFSLALDHIMYRGDLYSYVVNRDYTEDGVMKTDLATMQQSLIYDHKIDNEKQLMIQIGINKQGVLSASGPLCNSTDAATDYVCHTQIVLP